MFDFLKTKKNYEDVDAATFNTLMSETPDGIVLDVRTSDEFNQSSMNGATNIDIMAGNFTQKIESLDKNKTYFVYCRSGNRSGNACKLMSNVGFEHLYNLSGGLMKWTL